MDDVEVRVDELRGVFASVLATDLELVAVAHSTTEAVMRALIATELKPGDRVVTLDEEYPAIRGSLAARAARQGFSVATVSARDEHGVPISDAEIVARVTELLVPPTRAIVISRVSWISGRILPLEEILPRTRGAGSSALLTARSLLAQCLTLWMRWTLMCSHSLRRSGSSVLKDLLACGFRAVRLLRADCRRQSADSSPSVSQRSTALA